LKEHWLSNAEHFTQNEKIGEDVDKEERRTKEERRVVNVQRGFEFNLLSVLPLRE